MEVSLTMKVGYLKDYINCLDMAILECEKKNKEALKELKFTKKSL